MKDNDRARRDTETDDERQHRLSRMRENDNTRRDSDTDRERQQRLSQMGENNNTRRDSETAEIESDERQFQSQKGTQRQMERDSKD